VFEVDIKYKISIEQMKRTPTDWTIREYKEKGMLETKHYLVNMPDPSVKQTLCVMPDPQPGRRLQTASFLLSVVSTV
jgi:hypothetical protein